MPVAQATHNKVAFITGAGSGIGKATALLFSQRGFCIAAVDRQIKRAEETVAEVRLPKDAPKAVAIRTDISKPEDLRAAVQQAVDQLGRLDVCVNCAGIEGDRADTADYPVDVFDHVMAVNCRGTFLCMQEELKVMEQQEPGAGGFRGHIVNVSSTAGLQAMAGFSAYCASKWAILGMTKTAAAEYAPKHIRINAVCPATTDTPMVQRFTDRWPEWQAETNKGFPVGRICQPKEVAEAIWFLSAGGCPFMVGCVRAWCHWQCTEPL